MENFTRAFTVSGNVITDSKPTKKAGNAGENIVTSLSFTFSSEWDDAIKSIVFKSPKNKLLTPQTITGSIAPIPQDALDSGGTLQFSLMGAFADSEQVIRTPTYGLDVESTLSILGGTPLATYTNVVLDCQTATQEAITAKDAAVLATERIETTDAEIKAAEAVREAERLKWTSATAQATTLEPDELATASVTDGETGKIFNIGVPRGETGANGRNGEGNRFVRAFWHAMTANQENVSIVLNGDSTGDETTEWFYRLGAWIASKFPTHNVLYYDFPYAKQEFGQSKIIQVGINGLGYCVTGSGQYVRAASKAAYNITGDIEIAVKLQPTTLGATKYIAAKWGAAGNYSWYIAITSDNKIRFNRSSNGTITEYRDSTLAIPYAVNDVFWIKVCYDYDNGNNGNSTDFYTSADGITWTKLGATVVVAGIGAIFAGTGDLQFHAANGSNSIVGKFYEAYIRNGIGGSLVASVNMSLANFTYLTAAYTFNDIMGNEFELVATSKTGANTLVMINCSASGMGTSYSMDQNRFDKFTAFSEPHLFFVSYGHNEVGEYATYNTLYSALIDKILAKYPTTGFVGILQNPQRSPCTSIAIRKQARMMKNLSKLLSSRNLPFVDIYSSMLTDAGYSGYVNDVDGIHPTAAGEQFWAEQVEEFMFPL